VIEFPLFCGISSALYQELHKQLTEQDRAELLRTSRAKDLLAQLHLTPWDYALRLVLSDWLEEQSLVIDARWQRGVVHFKLEPELRPVTLANSTHRKKTKLWWWLRRDRDNSKMGGRIIPGDVFDLLKGRYRLHTDAISWDNTSSALPVLYTGFAVEQSAVVLTTYHNHRLRGYRSPLAAWRDLDRAWDILVRRLIDDKPISS
jgi:hypothetical protein